MRQLLTLASVGLLDLVCFPKTQNTQSEHPVLEVREDVHYNTLCGIVASENYTPPKNEGDAGKYVFQLHVYNPLPPKQDIDEHYALKQNPIPGTHPQILSVTVVSTFMATKETVNALLAQGTVAAIGLVPVGKRKYSVPAHLIAPLSYDLCADLKMTTNK